MIKFDISQVSFKFIQLRSITTALGGSLTHVNEQGQIERLSVPFAIARDFIKRHKGHTQYLNPVLTCVMFYDDLVIELERHPLGTLGKIAEEGVFGMKQWEPKCQTVFNDFVVPTMSEDDWYFDGRYAYTFDSEDLEEVVKAGRPLTEDGKFRAVEVASIDFQEIRNGENSAEAMRLCIAFMDNGHFTISPPVWKDGFNLTDGKNRFDDINDHYGVNLNFVLKAGSEVGKTFGYRSTEILDLARLMIELRTVNLPNIDLSVKATYDTQLPFKTMFAWLLGIQNRAESLKTYLITRSLLSYLTKKGIFKKNVLQADKIFEEGFTSGSIPLIDAKMAAQVFNEKLEIGVARLTGSN